MKKGLQSLLESEVLNQETKASILEAFKAKEEEVTKKLQKDFKQRYEQDNKNLKAAVEKAVTEAVEHYAAETADEIKKLKSERKTLATSLDKTKSEYKEKLRKESQMFSDIALSQLAEHIDELEEERKALAKERKEVKEHLGMLNKLVSSYLLECAKEQAEEVEQMRHELDSENKDRFKKLANFVDESLHDELSEFSQDRRALSEAKVSLYRKARLELSEMKKEFIEKTAPLVEAKINKQVSRELSGVKREIREAHENTAARKIFEAFKKEMSNSYNESTVARETMTEMRAMRKELEEARRIAESSKQSARLAEERAERVEIMNELLSPLSKEKRAVMEDLLATTKTAKLNEAFDRYLPSVLHETLNNTNRREMLAESSHVSRSVTGNKSNMLKESDQMDEITKLLRLSGLK